jgi:lipopolysaccharide transport system ATP-binding protein
MTPKVVKRTEKILDLQNVGLCYSRRQRFFKRFRFWALRDVSFELHAGETLGIIGRNGVGKSTLLRILAGIIAPSIGTMTVCRSNFRITLISLQAGFIPYLSGRENAILSGIILGATKKEILSQIENIIAFSELDSFFDEPVYTYSTGMRARLGFSVAYHLDPDVILLDEVLGVGDQAFRKKSTVAMKKRIKSEKTAVLVSHSAPLIREVCDRLIWIENGKTQAQGGVSEVLDAYLKYIGKK